jgi:hypothetical protein
VFATVHIVNAESKQRMLRYLSGAPAGAGRAECACAGSKPVASALTIIFVICFSVLQRFLEEGGDPRQALTVRLYFLSHVSLLRRSCALPSLVYFTLHLCMFILPPRLLRTAPPALSSSASPGSSSPSLFPAERRSLMRCSLYTPLPCLIQHAPAHCICLPSLN